MKKINTHSIFFRLAIMFVISLFVIISLIILTFHFFNQSENLEKAFLSPIEHIQKILEDIDETEQGTAFRPDLQGEDSGQVRLLKQRKKRSFHRFSVSVFDGEKMIYSDKEHDFTLAEFKKESVKVKDFENTATFRNESYLIMTKGERTIIVGNRKRKHRDARPFRYAILQLSLPLFLILMLMYYFIHKLLIPVNRLLPALNELRRGNFDYRIEFSTNDEFQSIIESFNEMASQIKVMFQNNLLLIGNISHDLKYYLTRLKMQVEIDIDDPDTRNSMNEDIDRMTDYIDRTLEVYRSNLKESQFKISKVNVSELIREKYRHADLCISNLEKEVYAELDENYLNVILDNLYDNALKYGVEQQTAPRVTLSLKTVDDTFEISLTNRTSFKFDDSDMKLLFQPFYRVDASRNQEIKGTGLGLFIVRQICDGLGLDINLRVVDGDLFMVIVSGPRCG